MSLPNVYVIYLGDKPVTSLGGKLYHHAKHHAKSSVRELAKDRARYTVKSSDWNAQRKAEEELQNTYVIREFKLVEVEK